MRIENYIENRNQEDRNYGEQLFGQIFVKQTLGKVYFNYIDAPHSLDFRNLEAFIRTVETLIKLAKRRANIDNEQKVVYVNRIVEKLINRIMRMQLALHSVKMPKFLSLEKYDLEQNPLAFTQAYFYRSRTHHILLLRIFVI